VIRFRVIAHASCDACGAPAAAESAGVAATRRGLKVRGWTTRIDGSGHRLDVCPRCRGNAHAEAKVAAAARQRARAARNLAAIEAEGPVL
jgi:hypothetical protein